MNFIYFDLETERSAQEVGGWHNIEQLGIAVGVTISSEESDYRVWRAADVVGLGEALRACNCVVGFNTRGFDFRVLQPYLDFDLKTLPNLDLMLDLKSVAGFRPSLDSCCGATLGESKSGGGLESLQWWREGRHDEVIEYCKQDVALTRKLHEFGANNGWVKCLDRTGKTRTLAVNWSLTQGESAPQQGSLF